MDWSYIWLSLLQGILGGFIWGLPRNIGKIIMISFVMFTITVMVYIGLTNPTLFSYSVPYHPWHETIFGLLMVVLGWYMGQSYSIALFNYIRGD